ncbi:hypothetical protein [Dehalococcoides mccartyi]|jgi:hypothetical protein|uniref:hypothetical protein n=1 Tax=Dehalococcoides mccartyi TaxID=61435 RepID=UPI0006BCA9F1|nr:hypothetical protein [Dehalococcoides mccartyi]BAS31205.1 hypothetical protein IBK_0130 [Dehalococcoides mccartyi IBARAKI]
MKRGRPNILGDDRVVIRVVLPLKDYQNLEKIADLERTDIGTLVRRAIVRQYFAPDDSKAEKNGSKR